jgi:acetyl/propionyl-CoA carboxylase alpha subunit
LYAEDPEHGYLPSTGAIHRFEVPVDEGVRVDAGVETGSEVGIHYDPLIAKLTAHASTRDAAARRLASTLERSRIHGPRTNRDLLVRILRHPDFLEGRTDTHFLERHDPAELGGALADAEAESVHAVAATLAAQAQRRAAARVLGSLPSGWRNNPSGLQQAGFEGPSGRLEIGYRVDGGTATVRVGSEEPCTLRVGCCTPERVELEWEGVQRSYDVHRVGDQYFVDSALGTTVLRELERFPLVETSVDPGSLTAPMPGVVRVVRVQEGEAVREGDVLLVLEAMKMEHEVLAGAAGRVTQLLAREGDQVDADQVLVVIEEDEGEGAA